MDIGETNIVKHQINTSSNLLIAQPLRKIPKSLEPQIEELIENLKSNNIIRESSSPWSSLLLLCQSLTDKYVCALITVG